VGGTSHEVFSWAISLGCWHRGNDAGAASGPLHHGEGFMGCSSDSFRDDCRLHLRGGSRQPTGLAAVCSPIAITSTTAYRKDDLPSVALTALRRSLVLLAVLLVAALASSSEAASTRKARETKQSTACQRSLATVKVYSGMRRYCVQPFLSIPQVSKSGNNTQISTSFDSVHS
jgi:hypothetical protein